LQYDSYRLAANLAMRNGLVRMTSGVRGEVLGVRTLGT
jgi:hypothetical protein